MINKFLFIFVILQAIGIGNALSPSERMACTKGLICAVSKNHLDFFAIGDTGGIEFNIGQGKISYVRPTSVQLRVADAMAKLAGKKGLDFVLNVGDNVYFNGVDDEFDTRFETVFEKPYSHKELQVPWYMIAGNHDYLGNVTAQIEYTKHSNKWTFPSPYYKLEYAFSGYSKRVDFLFIDTVIMCGNSVDVDSRSVWSWVSAAERLPEKPDPPYVEESKKQWQWLEMELKNSKADYLFVVGHYPMYSLSLQRLKCLYDKMDSMLRKYRVTAYISGHDHSVQYFRDEGDKNRSPMRYLVTGAGSRTGPWGNYGGDENTKLLYRYPKQARVPFMQGRFVQQKNEFGFGQGAFVHFTLRQDRADLYFYAKDLELEFQESIPPRNLTRLNLENSNSKTRLFKLDQKRKQKERK